MNAINKTDAPLLRPAFACVAGYGIVCGLVFPLMISSTFLQEMSLSHGAGNSFGVLFFAAYTLTMLINAAVRLITRRTAMARRTTMARRTVPARRATAGHVAAGHAAAGHVPAEHAAHGTTWMLAGLGSAFAGNTLMLLRQLGVFAGGWPYTVAMALTIGFGLATSELGWMGCMAALRERRPGTLMRAMSLAYLVGSAAAAVIFAASGPIELAFALGIIAFSVLLVARRGAFGAERRATAVPDEARAVAGSGGERHAVAASGEARVAEPGCAADERGGVADFIKAVSYLAIFSFVFGAVSQVSTATEYGEVSIEFQALLGIVLAAALMLAASLRRPGRLPVADLYWVLFPVVAVTLVALPFIQAPVVHAAASVLVFTAFYLTGINVRVIVCQLCRAGGGRIGLYASVALGVGSLCILAGVALGAAVLSNESPAMALAFISLVSLFVLSLSPMFSRFVERRLDLGGTGTAASVAVPGRGGPLDVHTANGRDATEVPAAQEARTARMRAYADEHGMTAREAEVLALVCLGRTRTYIAASLGISPNTVKGYIHSMYQKAGVANKQDLIDRVESFVGQKSGL